MICPNCGSEQTRVVDSRQQFTVRHRRYKCFDCGKRFTTREVVVRSQPDEEEPKREH